MGIPNEDITMILSCLEEERYQDARDLLDEAIGKDINNHNLYYLKAITCIHMNKLDEALIDLGEVAYLNPHHIPSMHALAFLFLKRGDFESAVNKWLAITTVSPNDVLAKQNLKLVKEKRLVKNSLNQYNINDFIVLDFKALKKGMAFQFDAPFEKQKVIEATTYINPPQTLKDVSLMLGQGDLEPPRRTSFLSTLNFKSISLIIFFLLCIIFSSILIFRIHMGKQSFNENLRAFTQFLNIAPIQFSYTDAEIQNKKPLFFLYYGRIVIIRLKLL
jgi:tetratricopeptide (TPR) repeat protein